MHNMNDVPEHIMEEIHVVYDKLMKAIGPILEEHNSNISLGAFNVLHCAILKHLISDAPGELEKAVLLQCQSLIKNLEMLAGREFKFEEFEKKD